MLSEGRLAFTNSSQFFGRFARVFEIEKMEIGLSGDWTTLGEDLGLRISS